MIHALLTTWFVAAAVSLSLPQQPGDTRQRPPGPDHSKPATDYLNEMLYLDTNADRQIDREELFVGQEMAYMLLMLSWDQCDQDLDGTISLSELQAAARAALQKTAGAEEEDETEHQAEDAIARAIPLKLLLDSLARDAQYAEEIAALREALEDLDDEEAVITYIAKSPVRYKRLHPVINTWLRHYPVNPKLRGYAKPRVLRPSRPATRAKALRPAKPGPNVGKPRSRKPVAGGKPGPKKPTKPRSKPGRKPRR